MEKRKKLSSRNRIVFSFFLLLEYIPVFFFSANKAKLMVQRISTISVVMECEVFFLAKPVSFLASSSSSSSFVCRNRMRAANRVGQTTSVMKYKPV